MTKHRTSRRNCRACGRIFWKRADGRFCSPRCQGRSWTARHRRQARRRALVWYYQHREECLQRLAVYNAQNRDRFRTRINRAMRAWYLKHRRRLCARRRLLYAQHKGTKVRKYARRKAG
jgi:hypothetical protein